MNLWKNIPRYQAHKIDIIMTGMKYWYKFRRGVLHQGFLTINRHG